MNSKGFITRQSFVAAGFTAFALAACGGRPSLTPSPVDTTLSQDDLYRLMRKTGVLAFWQNGVLTALPESRYGTGTGSGRQPLSDCPEPLSKTRRIETCSTPAPQPPPITIQYFIDPVVQVTGGSVSVYGSDYDPDEIGLQGNYTGYPAGPIFVATPPVHNCIGETLAAAGQTASTIATYIINNGYKYSADIIQWAKWFVAGEITALDFIGVFLTILAAPDVLMILGAVALTLGALWLLYNCLHG
jgi:hypothetical protein